MQLQKINYQQNWSLILRRTVPDTRPRKGTAQPSSSFELYNTNRLCRDFNPSTWIEQMGRGILRQYCESMCTCICTPPSRVSMHDITLISSLGEYQMERNKRILQFSYPDDPFNLFLEEIKGFVTKTVSHLSCDRNARDMLRKRVRPTFPT